MAETGFLGHDAAKEGAVLKLSGGPEDDLTLRAYVGPRTSEPTCGLLAAYTDGELVARLYAEPEPAMGGVLLLSSQIPGQADPVWLARVTTGFDGPDRWGLVTVRARDGAGGVEDIVRLDAGGAGGAHDRERVEVRDATNVGRRGWLSVGEDGPELFLRRTENQFVRITARGVEVSPDKEGFFDLVSDHPSDSTKELHYTVMEGPEVGLYIRGTTRLVEGAAVVDLPEHFSFLASAEQLTVQLTARDASSKGLAAVELTPARLRIAELMQGRGAYAVDYQVHGVRKGREDYSVERPRKAR